MSRNASSAPAQGPRRRPFWSDLLLALALLCVLALLAKRVNRPEGYNQSGTVSIHDGDTLTLNGEKIRLLYIDAPELRQLCRRGGQQYWCGESSRDELIRLVGSNPVSCSGDKRDRYRRLLGDCRAGGIDLNTELVRIGWAVAYDSKLKAEEEDARRRKVGLWAGEFENPKEWRAQRGDAAGLEFDGLTETFVRVGEALGLIQGRQWQKEGERLLDTGAPAP